MTARDTCLILRGFVDWKRAVMSVLSSSLATRMLGHIRLHPSDVKVEDSIRPRVHLEEHGTAH